MAENAGHLVKVSIHTALGGPYSEISGVNSVSLQRDREELDTTHFKDTSGHKLAIVGLKSTTLEISGNLDLADAPQSQLRSRYADGASTFIEIQWDGSTSADGEFKVTSYSEEASVDGIVTFSCSLVGTPNSSASAVWG